MTLALRRAALYLRSSKDRSDVSIDAQRRALHATASARGLVVVAEFADAVESGKDEDRPGFQHMLHELRSAARAWSTVLVLDTSRIARRRMISLMFESDCSKRGVALVYNNLPDHDPATDMVLRSVLQAFDEYHSLVSRAKGLAGMAENVRQGWRAGGRAPRGYRLEQVATGAIRDGEPVTKSRLVLDEELAPVVRGYLQLRAAGVPRGPAIARTDMPWPTSSVHAMDWQALTYAGHTVWGVESDAPDGVKRRPRAEWLIQRNTHEALITDDEAEAILVQVELSLQGRRMRASPLLLTGLLQTDGEPWHSDGCGFYRLGKGRKLMAANVERAVLWRLREDLLSEATVERVRASMQAMASGEQVDGRRVAGLERRANSLSNEISRTVGLASRIPDPAPVLRRVTDLEHQLAALLGQIEELRRRQKEHSEAAGMTDDQVRALLRRLFDEIAELTPNKDRRAEARVILAELLDRIELNPANATARLHYSIRSSSAATGDKVATPRGFEPLLQP
ncbi:MAG: recombinase family protein [Burkholderiaceae bacterium]|nr:recombinase family protein [Burkholderiaceae bacterium]